MSERKPGAIDKVKCALYRTAAEPRKATWAIYGAVGISTLLLFGATQLDAPKWPRNVGD
jgi:hypothetical protein